MSPLRRIIVVAAALGSMGAPAADASAEVLTRTITIGQTQRSYILFLPDSPTALGTGFPLVVVLHGGGGTAEQMMRFSRFNESGERERAVVAYPQGIARSWNDGRSFRGRDTGVDDVGFIRAMVADIGANVTPLDRRRIYAAGISNGGFMSYRLACEAADLFAAVAPVAATMPAELGPRCKPSAPISVLAINGTADPLVPYGGGDVRVMFRTRGEIWSTDQTIAFWSKHNHCKGDVVVRTLPDRDTTDQSTVRQLDVHGCTAPVRLLRVEGGGHTWPGGAQYLPVTWIGPTNRDIDATETIWRFFTDARR